MSFNREEKFWCPICPKCKEALTRIIQMTLQSLVYDELQPNHEVQFN